MRNSSVMKVGSFAIIFFLLLSQTGCGLAKRLRQPIEDFRAATSVVSESARLGYANIIALSLDDTLRRSQCAEKRNRADCLPSRSDALKLVAGRTISNEGMKARLAALDSLSKYVALLTELVNSDKPEQISTAADELRQSIDALAVQITRLDKPDSDADAQDSAEHAANQQRFVASVGIFSKAIGIVLSAIATRKQDKALKRAVLDGDGAVKDIIAGLKSDFTIFWSSQTKDANTELISAFRALNTEIDANQSNTGTRPDTGALRQLRQDVIDALTVRDTLAASNPTGALDAMQKAHEQLVKVANEPIEANFVATAEAIQLYLSAATQLGEAIIKLHRIKNPENPE